MTCRSYTEPVTDTCGAVFLKNGAGGRKREQRSQYDSVCMSLLSDDPGFSACREFFTLKAAVIAAYDYILIPKICSKAYTISVFMERSRIYTASGKIFAAAFNKCANLFCHINKISFMSIIFRLY